MKHTLTLSPFFSCAPRTHSRVSRACTKVATVGLLLLLCLSTLVLPCAAVAVSSRSDAEIAEDGTWIRYQQTTYSYYNIPGEWHILPERVSVYSDPVIWNGVEYMLCTDTDSSQILWLWDEETDTFLLYTTDIGRILLDDFAQETNVHYYLAQDITSSRCRRAALPQTAFETLNHHPATASTVTVDVRDLRTLTRYDILMYDKSQVVYRICGAVYEKGDTFLYVDYRNLNNTYFDADGNFSYRSGNVNATSFTAEEGYFLGSPIDSMQNFRTKYTYEEDLGFDDTTAIAVQVTVFWVFFVLIGYLLPIAPLVVGLVMPRSAKRGFPKRYYLAALLALVWMCLAGIITLLLLL